MYGFLLEHVDFPATIPTLEHLFLEHIPLVDCFRHLSYCLKATQKKFKVTKFSKSVYTELSINKPADSTLTLTVPSFVI